VSSSTTGDEDSHVFICYAHADLDEVGPLLGLLGREGIPLWYDDGITIGAEWSDSLAQAIENCTQVLFLASSAAVASEHCRREISFAQSESKPIVTVHLESVEMPSGLRLALNHRQAILKYALEPNVFMQRLVSALLDTGDSAPSIVSTGHRVKQPRWRIHVAVFVGLSLVLGIATQFLLPEQNATDSTIDMTAAQLPNSIAVLPFKNLSRSAEDAYLADAVHDTVLHELAKIDELNVIARSTMQHYADDRRPIAELARSLRVENVMEGSVQFAQERVRLQVTLLDPFNGKALWTGEYEKPLQDLFVIQREIATEIATALRVEILDDEFSSIGKPFSESTEAMVFYLKARAITDNIAPNMPAEMYTFLDAALAADPDMAIAHGLKSFALVLSLGVVKVGGMDLKTHKELVLRHAELALASPDGAGYGYAAKAMVAEQLGDWALAETLWRRATAAAPNDFDVLDDYARFMAFIGDVETAQAVVSRGQALNPADLQLEHGINMILGKFDEISADSPFVGPMERILIHTVQGHKEKAIELADAIADLVPPVPAVFGYMCYTYARNGHVEQAEPWCRQVEELPQLRNQDPIVHQVQWMAAVARGGVAAVVRALENIEQDELMGPFYFRYINNVFNDAVMDEPAVLAVRRRMGFRQ
jgi:TolB-like protein